MFSSFIPVCFIFEYICFNILTYNIIVCFDRQVYKFQDGVICVFLPVMCISTYIVGMFCSYVT